MVINLDNLYVTQSSIRNWDRVVRMIDFVRNGGIFTNEFIQQYHNDESSINHQPMKIKIMPDDKHFLHDGHHRAIALWIAGRKELYPEEYTTHNWPSYESFSEVNLSVGWVTPLDIREEIRYPDVVPFKERVLMLPCEDQLDYIMAHKSEYCHPRNGINYVSDLVKCVLDGQCCTSSEGCPCKTDELIN